MMSFRFFQVRCCVAHGIRWVVHNTKPDLYERYLHNLAPFFLYNK